MTNKWYTTMLYGSIMGMAEMIPNGNGSNFALVFGIYDDFINFLFGVSNFFKAIALFILRRMTFKDLKASLFEINFKFGIFLFSGMLISIALLSNVMDYIFESFPNYVSALFFGLVLASVVIPYREMTKFNLKMILIIIVSALLTFWLLGMAPNMSEVAPSLFILFFGGVIGVSGLILPGISGSFLMYLLGVYQYVISVVKSLTHLQINWQDLFNLAIFMLGLITGFVFFVRLIKWLLTKYPNELLATLIGFMLGSLRAIYPFFDVLGDSKIANLPFVISQNYNLLGIYGFILIGFIVVVVMSILSNRSEKN